MNKFENRNFEDSKPSDFDDNHSNDMEPNPCPEFRFPKKRMEKEKKKAYSYLTLQQRQEVLNIFVSCKEKGERLNYTAIAEQFNVSRKTISRMHNSKNNWTQKLEKTKDLPSFEKRKRVPTTRDLDESLYDWCKQKRMAGETISGTVLKEKGLLVNEIVNGKSDFKASDGWLSRFKRRYQIRNGCIQEEKGSAEVSASAEFVKKLRLIMVNQNLKPHQVYNAKEMGCYWRSLPETTFVDKFEKDTGFKASKQRVTVMVAANADGSHKVPLFVIGPTNVLSCFKTFNMDQLPVKYAGQRNCWMTKDLFRHWYTKVFLPSVQKHQQEKDNYKVLLILDSAKCHLLKGEIDSINESCSVEFFPLDVNSLVQPMEQGVIEELKRVYRVSLLREMLLERDEECIKNFILSRNMKNFCIQIASSWNKISADNISQAWRKLIEHDCHINISTARNESFDDFLNILDRIPGFENCREEEIDTWLRVDRHLLGYQSSNVNENLHIIHNLPHNVASLSEEYFEDNDYQDDRDQKDEEDDNNTVDEALKAYMGFKIFRKWMEKRWECLSSDHIQMQRQEELTKDIVSHLLSLEMTEHS
ncbi:jerky protein homolog-like isoform X1 [Leptopilina heterotoma]|uniref:jerky protein homolog-like isoform X1 n=1 Tax=Leptopilina heterotoma TaxID=63436 RepID=UPI001CA999F9|nr:jerky protein homolog-like isoform X1 [Leptopilina heterotoma]